MNDFNWYSMLVFVFVCADIYYICKNQFFELCQQIALQ